MNRRLLLLSIFVSCALGVGHAQNLINNPSFEAAPHAPSSDMIDWMTGVTATAGHPDAHIHSIQEGATDGQYDAAFSVGRDSEGTTLFQTFPTVVGNFYQIDFDAGVFGTRTGPRLKLRVQIINPATNAVILDRLVTPPDAGTFNPSFVQFNHYTFGFTANSGSTKILFTDVNTGNASADVVLDKVSVVQATPPPPNLAPNFDFEQGPFGFPGTVTGWTVTGNVAAYHEGATSGTNSAVFSAGADSSDDMLSKTFSTTPGQMYTLDFDAGIYGRKATPAFLLLVVDVTGNTSLVHDTLIPPDAETFDEDAVLFNHYHYQFTADTTSFTLKFTGQGAANAQADQVLDTVVLAAVPGGPTPTPTPTPTATPATPTPTPTPATPTPTPATPTPTPATPTPTPATPTPTPATPTPTPATPTPTPATPTPTPATPTPTPATPTPTPATPTPTPATPTPTPTVPPASPTPTPTTLPLVNGSFETPPYDTVDTIPGWTAIGTGQIEQKVEGATSGSHSAAFSTGSEPQGGNTLRQQFRATPGATYRLVFDAGIFGRTSANLQLRVRVFGTAVKVDQVITPPNSGTWDPLGIRFDRYTIDFTADNSVMTLEFIDVGGDFNADQVVDTVSVTQIGGPTLSSTLGS